MTGIAPTLLDMAWVAGAKIPDGVGFRAMIVLYHNPN